MEPLKRKRKQRRPEPATYRAKKQQRSNRRPQPSAQQAQARARGLTLRPNKRVKNNENRMQQLFPSLNYDECEQARSLEPGSGALSYLPPSTDFLANIKPLKTDSANDSKPGAAPWMLQSVEFEPLQNHETVGLQLSREILMFALYFSPSTFEEKQRSTALDKLRKTAGSLWADARISVFGSVATGVFLPNADIDVVLFSRFLSTTRLRSEMFRFARRLDARCCSQTKTCEVVSHARVPIIKYVDANSRIPIDVSFEQRSGLVSVKTVKSWLKEEPALKLLVMVVRRFLRVYDLHEVFHGGIGGFATICMVHAFLRNHSTFGDKQFEAVRNVGVLLLEFFTFYGTQFDNLNNAVVCTGNCEPKRVKPVENSGIMIIDPNDANNNISKGSRNYASVKQCFAKAADILRVELYKNAELPLSERQNHSFLKPVLKSQSSDFGRGFASLDALFDV